MPLLIVIMAIFFNTVNSYINGYYLGTLQNQYSSSWLTDARFIVGILLFFTGMIINISADETLIHLRKSKTNGYLIPYGRLFNKISCPNFFGEIIEWLGFAILCWSLPALSFFVWTVCNLVPRALDHHRWYKRHFADYPVKRKAVFPYLLWNLHPWTYVLFNNPVWVPPLRVEKFSQFDAKRDPFLNHTHIARDCR